MKGVNVERGSRAPWGFKFNTHKSVEGVTASILNHLNLTLARDIETATRRDWWISTCLTVHDRILERFIGTMKVHNDAKTGRPSSSSPRSR